MQTVDRGIRVLKAGRSEVVDFDWGQLTWFASGKLGNSDEMTVGRCVLKPGMANPMHSHPNCSEVLVVLQGTIMHTVGPGGEEAEFGPGDTVCVAANCAHRARNVGPGEAVLLIAFSAPDRETVGE